MAEALGFAASVLQIIDAVSKLKDFWNSVKNAPDDLVDCVHDIQRTAMLLDQSKNLVSTSTGICDDHLTECAQDLENALAALRALTLDLQKGLPHHKRLGVLRIVLKKDEIARGRRKLERAQSLLSTAQQHLALTLELRHTSVSNQNHALLLQLYSAVQNIAQSAPGSSKSSRFSTSDTDTPTLCKRSDEQLEIHSPRSTSHHSRKANSSYSIRFPRWLTRRYFEIIYHREISSMRFTITSYNVVSKYSLGHEAARTGNLSQLKGLLETGQVSPFDQSDSGETLLQAALSGTNLHTAQFLISQWPDLGCKIDTIFVQELLCDWPNLCFVEELTWDFNLYSQRWDLLKKCVDIDEDMLYEVEQYIQARGKMGSWVEWLPLMYKAARQGVQVLPKQARISLAVSASCFDIFKQLVGTDISTHEILDLISYQEFDHTVLLVRIFRLAFLEDEDEVKKWSDIVRGIFEFDKLRGSDFCWSTFTMQWFLFDVSCGGRWRNEHWIPSLYPELWNKILLKWVQYLEAIGVDLEHYGQRESDAPIEQYGCWTCVEFKYGPKATDWKFLFEADSVEYEWAGEFWNRIENPELYLIPGAFL